VSTFRVLVVDDSTADFDLIDISMEEALGNTVALDHATTMDIAAQLIGKNEYSLILHDLFLPPWGPESITATYKIARDTPIIAISGQSSPDLHRTAVSNGAKLFCSKADLGGGNIASILAQIVPDFRIS
jgi:CheY-like chemotaxis protein